jgi:hypothetical protein
MGPVNWRRAAVRGLWAAGVTSILCEVLLGSPTSLERVGYALGAAVFLVGDSALRQSGRGRLANGIAMVVGGVLTAPLWREDLVWRIRLGSIGGAMLLLFADRKLRRAGRRGLASALVVVTVVGYLATGTFQMSRQRRVDRSVLTDVERASLVAAGDGPARRLLHPTLGFSIKDPGPDFRLAASQAFDPGTELFIYENEARGDTVVLGLFKGIDGSAASIYALLLGMQDRGTVGTTSLRGLAVTSFEAVGGASPHGALEGWLGEARYRLRVSGFTSDGVSYAFMIALASLEPHALDDVLTSFVR